MAVALSAVLRETRVLVIGACRGLEVRQVTSNTSVRCVGIPLRMAFNTLISDNIVLSNKWIYGIVIECARRPCRFVMTLGAILRKSGLCVIRIGGGVEVIKMATYTSIWRIGVAIRVTQIAIGGDGGVMPLERIYGIVIKGRWHPTRNGVTLGAVVGESGVSMLRVGCSLEIIQVAAGAFR